MHNITVIIPITNKLDENEYKLLENALTSLKEQNDKKFDVLLVVPKDIDSEYTKRIEEFIGNDLNFQWSLNEGAADYQSQINWAVNSSVQTPYFSVLQFDDELLNNYMKNANQYVEAYDYDAFTSIIFELDDNNNFIGFANESVWSINHMEKFGVFDLNSVKKHSFANYNICGMVIKKEAFLSAGALKPSILKYHDYEFLLRLLNSGKKIFNMPKICYKHVNGRTGSIYDSQKSMSEVERKFWYDLAKKEYHFDYDREIEFVQE